jgi:acetylornithine/succinyldiaminopimelate/putrescine aminotransferase
MTALTVLKEEGMVENSFKCVLCMQCCVSPTHYPLPHRMGELFRSKLRTIKSPMIKEVRGRGLMNAVVIKPNEDGKVRNLPLLYQS